MQTREKQGEVSESINRTLSDFFLSHHTVLFANDIAMDFMCYFFSLSFFVNDDISFFFFFFFFFAIAFFKLRISKEEVKSIAIHSILNATMASVKKSNNETKSRAAAGPITHRKNDVQADQICDVHQYFKGHHFLFSLLPENGVLFECDAQAPSPSKDYGQLQLTLDKVGGRFFFLDD